MLDMQLYVMLKAIIEAQEPYFGIPNVNGVASVPLAQNFQPTQQGVMTGPCAYLEIIGHRRIGQPGRADFLDTDTDQFVHQELQVMETKFQLSALATQDPKSTTQYTAADIVNLMAMILQNTTTIEQLEAQKCGILLAKETRNPKSMDDRGRFEANPSLDFSITHNLIVTKAQPVLQSEEFKIYSI